MQNQCLEKETSSCSAFLSCEIAVQPNQHSSKEHHYWRKRQVGEIRNSCTSHKAWTVGSVPSLFVRKGLIFQSYKRYDSFAKIEISARRVSNFIDCLSIISNSLCQYCLYACILVLFSYTSALHILCLALIFSFSSCNQSCLSYGLSCMLFLLES